MRELPRIGAEVAGYRLESLVSRGGMAVVYLAQDLRLSRMVALKILAAELADDDNFRERFLRESRVAASIDHPNVIPIYDAGEADGVLYIAMRHVEDSDLRGLLSAAGPLEIERTIAIGSQVAGALDAAHRLGPRPPRRQAGQRPAHPPAIAAGARPRLPLRLRARQAHQLDHRADSHGPVRRHGQLHGAGAGPGQAGRRTHRHLRARLRPVRVPHRQAAVPQGRGRGGGHGPHQRAGAAA